MWAACGQTFRCCHETASHWVAGSSGQSRERPAPSGARCRLRWISEHNASDADTCVCVCVCVCGWVDPPPLLIRCRCKCRCKMHGHVWWLVLIPLIPCHPRTARSCVARRGCQTLASKPNAVSTGKERGAPCRSLDTPPRCAEPSDAFLCASGGRKQPAPRPSASLKVRRRSSSRPPNHDSKLAPNGCSALSRTRREPATPIVEGVRKLVREKVRRA